MSFCFEEFYNIAHKCNKGMVISFTLDYTSNKEIEDGFDKETTSTTCRMKISDDYTKNRHQERQVAVPDEFGTFRYRS